MQLRQSLLVEKAVLPRVLLLGLVNRRLLLRVHQRDKKDWEKGSKGLLCAISSASIVKAPALETNGTIRTTDVITTGGCSAR